ncbi:hypothetical protein [Streptomyces sp. TP-A0356]|uniref:hypothetical protein n=1 Tax=Streptomyces sp. TP-A0356 TaxID=1359208 RepID=UPI0006E1C44D|nr:hypothetical protein [Streptomyces sp. TP-A0356]
MTTPENVEPRYTLLTAAARLDELRARESLAGAGSGAGQPDRGELLELLALSEVVARKAAYGRQLTVRAARAAGASWAQIGAALGTSRQAACEAHARWLDAHAAAYGRPGRRGTGTVDAAGTRTACGEPGES